MEYYHIPTSTIYDDHSAYANKLTRCGEPWKLDLTQFDSVPVVKETLTATTKQGTPVLESTRYYYPAVDKTVEEYNLGQDILRKMAYAEEADNIYLNETEHAISESRQPDYTLWMAKKAEIRARYPYRS